MIKKIVAIVADETKDQVNETNVSTALEQIIREKDERIDELLDDLRSIVDGEVLLDDYAWSAYIAGHDFITWAFLRSFISGGLEEPAAAMLGTSLETYRKLYANDMEAAAKRLYSINKEIRLSQKDDEE